MAYPPKTLNSRFSCVTLFKMTAKILTLSIPEDMFNWLNQNTGLSPSKIIQAKINELMDNELLTPAIAEARQEILKLRKVKDNLQEWLQEANEFIFTKGLTEEFKKYRQENGLV